MSESTWHISSAVVMVAADRVAGVVEEIAVMEGVEIHAHGDSRLIVVIEGGHRRELGDKLVAIGNLEGVLAANLVYEHVDEGEDAKT